MGLMVSRARSFARVEVRRAAIRPVEVVEHDFLLIGVKVGFSAKRHLSNYSFRDYQALLERLTAFHSASMFDELLVDPPVKLSGVPFAELPNNFLLEQMDGNVLDLTDIYVKHLRFRLRPRDSAPSAPPVMLPPPIAIAPAATEPEQSVAPPPSAEAAPSPRRPSPLSPAGIKKLFTAGVVAYYKIKLWAAKRLNSEKAKINLIEFRNRAGEKIAAIVDYPDGVSPAKASSVPWVIIPPAWGKRKETYFLLALYLKKNGIGVVRYDDTHGEGESDGTIASARLSLSQENIIAAVDYLSQALGAEKIAVAPFSLSARPALRVAALDKRIGFLFPVVGSPNIQGLLQRVYGEDLVGGFSSGRRVGTVNMIGFFTDGDNFLGDVVRSGYADLDSAKADLEKVGAPVVWYCGADDPWVDPREVEAALQANPRGAHRQLKVIAGLTHRFREAETAHKIFADLTAEASRLMKGEALAELAIPSDGEVIERGLIERSRISVQHSRESEAQRWENYLEGFDILLETDEYLGYLRDLNRAIDFQPGESLLDAGCGTGNFIEFCLTALEQAVTRMALAGGAAATGGKILGIDLVASALAKAGEKAGSVRARRTNLPETSFRNLDVDISPLKAIERFNRGELELEDLNRFFDGLQVDFESFSREARAKIRLFIRGGLNLDFVQLARIAGPGNAEKILELGQLSRSLQGETLALPFEDASFDKIAASLLLSYLRNPGETLSELVRALKPGGTIAITSLKPDADISQIYYRFLEKIKKKYSGAEQEAMLDRARQLFNEAIGWIEVEEESGRFHYFSEEELRQMLAENGITDIAITSSFGGQGLIASGKKS